MFRLLEKACGGEALDLLREAAATTTPLRNVKIRILIASADDDDNNNNTTEGMTEAAATTTTNATNTTMTEKRIIRQLKESGIDVRRTTQRQRQENFLQNNRLTLLIVDQSSYLTVELDDDSIKTSEDEEEAIELATYSNSEATVLLISQYLRIFGCGRRYRASFHLLQSSFVWLLLLLDRRLNRPNR
jgi:soluble P-type ATPase